VTSVAVVGGGVTGLAAARRLVLAGVHVTVLEQGTRWGGKLDRTLVEDLGLDTGAESVLARRPEALDLIAELGLRAAQVHPTAAQPQLLVGGRLHALPPSLQGVPVDVAALAGLLSVEGYAYAAAEPDRPAPPLPGDVAVGAYVDERFGTEVTDRLLEPLLGGVYAGRSRDLSFAAVLPDLFARARAGGSLLAHARGCLAPGSTTPVFAGLVGGVSGLARALVADLAGRGAELRTGAVVRGLSRVGSGWRLELGPGPEALDVDGVVLAAPAGPAGRLTAGLLAGSAALAAIPYASVAVVTLVVRGLDTDRSGLLIPPGELPTVKALTHSSVKWAWVREQAERTWGPGVAVVRASVGRAGDAGVLQLPDEDLLDRTAAEVGTLPGWDGVDVLHRRLTRWGGALPQYQVGHRGLVTDLRTQLAAVPGLALAGAALDGVGIAACLASADTAVTKIIGDLGRDDHDRDLQDLNTAARRQESQR
jgi:oxygen-dependent protoporphyrinogen oxidase